MRVAGQRLKNELDLLYSLTFIYSPSPGGYIRNLVTIGSVVSEKKSFEIVDGRWMDDDGG